MMHPAHVEIGLVRLGDSDFVPANPENDIRGKDVYDAEGQRIGSVEDLYIDRHERAVRFLEVGTGGFLGDKAWDRGEALPGTGRGGR